METNVPPGTPDAVMAQTVTGKKEQDMTFSLPLPGQQCAEN
jgi:hypothetical protein